MSGRRLRLVICGAAGRMGAAVTALAAKDRRFTVAALMTREGPPLATALSACDVVVDFSSPEATARLAREAARTRTPLVTGTTGATPVQRAAVRAAGRRTAVLAAPNMSLGVNVLLALVQTAAARLKGYRVSISETHHVHKKDAPSGTALLLAEAVRAARGPRETVRIASERKGAVVGVHTTRLSGTLETLSLTHEALDRKVFAAGALEAAAWLAGRRPGLYSMRDVLGLE